MTLGSQKSWRFSSLIPYEAALHGIMPRRRAAYVLKKALQFRGIDALPLEFLSVAPGKEWGPGGEALWRAGQEPREIITACLSFIARHLARSSFPPNCPFGSGDIGIFLQPPVLRSDRENAKNGVCLEFSRARATGLWRSGRYRMLLLGHNAGGQPVVIGAHRLICWAVHAPPEETDRRFHACHTSEGCEPRLPCCSPLHLHFATISENRQDVRMRKKDLDWLRLFNLRSTRR